MKINIDNIDEIEDTDFKGMYKTFYDKKESIPNYLEQFHNEVQDNQRAFPQTIKQRVELEKKFKDKYIFDNVLVVTCVVWIHKNVKLVDGEHAGKPLKMTLTQKWAIANIVGWWTQIENGDYERVVKEYLIMVASGFGKTTFLGALNTLFTNVKEIFGDTKIYIGANSQQQANLCFDITLKMIKKSQYKKAFALRPSANELEHKNTGALIRSMSSKGDNYEGIIPSVVIIDEIHAMATSKYVDNFRKNRTKRRDMLVFEITTQGDKRQGYLDNKLEYARKVLKGEVVDDEKCFIIFENESIEEVLEAYKNNDYDIIKKSNPNIGTSQDPRTLMDLIKEMINDPSKRVVTLTKNFNIPQNPETSYYSNDECVSRAFDEEYMRGKAVFYGLDVAYTRRPKGDLTAITFVAINPNNNKMRHLDYFLLPKKYIDNEQNLHHDMVEQKTALDGVDYQYFIDRGDVVLIDATEITQDHIIEFTISKIKELGLNVLKFGVDPNKADKIINTFNALVNDPKYCLPYLSERKIWNTPIIEFSKEQRNKKNVFTNNQLTEIHFAKVRAKYDSNNYILLTNATNDRKDMVIAHMAAYSAYHVWSKQIDVKINISNFENLSMSYKNEE